MTASPASSGTVTLIVGMIMIIATGLLVGIGGGAMLRRLPEPVPPAAADEVTLADYRAKISYRTLATPRFALITGLLAAAGATVAALTQPVAYWPVWFVFGVVAVLLAGIDARTTWLPGGLMMLGWVVTAIAVLACLAADPHRLHAAITIGSGVLIAAGGYLVLWLITGGRAIAFGDVRLMVLVGAVAGTLGWSGIYWSLLLGSVIGAVIGVLRLVSGRHGPFPYGPALVSGPYAAAVLLSLLP